MTIFYAQVDLKTERVAGGSVFIHNFLLLYIKVEQGKIITFEEASAK